jgi:hypothetical protein
MKNNNFDNKKHTFIKPEGMSVYGKIVGIMNAKNVIIEPVKRWTEHLYNIRFITNIRNLK